MKRPNPISPARMTPAERRSEMCALLGLGLVRLKARQSSGNCKADAKSSLHFFRTESVSRDNRQGEFRD